MRRLRATRIPLPVLILAHQLAHAIAGRLVGLHIHTIRVGDGCVLVRFRLGAARIGLGSAVAPLA